MTRLLFCALLLLARTAAAGAVHFYVPADAIHPSEALPTCERTTEGDKTVWLCSPTFGVWAPIWFPEGIQAVCAGGSNDGFFCTTDGDCTGGGACHAYCSVDVHFHMAVTPVCVGGGTAGAPCTGALDCSGGTCPNSICFESGLEASPVGGNWVANDGRSGNIVKNSTGVAAIVNTTSTVHIPLVDTFNDNTGLNCLPGNCANAQVVLAVDRPDSSFCLNDLDTADAKLEGVDVRCPTQ